MFSRCIRAQLFPLNLMRTIIPPRRGAERLIIRCHRRASQAPKHLPRISSLPAFPSLFFFFSFFVTMVTPVQVQHTSIPHPSPPSCAPWPSHPNVPTLSCSLPYIYICIFFLAPRRNISDARPSRQTASANGSRSPALPSPSNAESLQRAGRGGSSQSRVV